MRQILATLHHASLENLTTADRPQTLQEAVASLSSQSARLVFLAISRKSHLQQSTRRSQGLQSVDPAEWVGESLCC